MNRDREPIWPVEYWRDCYPHPADRRLNLRHWLLLARIASWAVIAVVAIAVAWLGAGWIGPEGVRW